MPDVVEQLRSYGDAVEAEVEPAEVTPRTNRRPLLLAAAVLVVLAAAASAVWVLQRGGEDARPPVISTVPHPELPDGWQTLDSGPLVPREGAAVVWTGDELVVWGGASTETGRAHRDGAAYDPATGDWRMMAAPPVERGGLVGGAWTGEEVLVWSTETDGEADDLPPWTVLAWNPTTDAWRRAGGRCDRGPFSTCPTERPARPWGTGVLEPVWTGTEVVDIAIGAAYDPARDLWRTLPERPILGDPQAVVWAGDRVVVLIANRSDASYPAGEAVGLTYDPSTDSWEALAPTGVGETAVDLTWDGEQVVALDYDMQAATYRPGEDEWVPLPPVPLRFYECSPEVTAVAGTVLAQYCSGDALLTPSRQWAIAPPSSSFGAVVDTGDELLSWSSSDDHGDPPGSTLRSYRPPELAEDDLAVERTVPIGTVLLDLPAGARLTDTAWGEEAGGLVTHLGFVLDLPDGEACTLTSTYSTIQSEIRIRNDASTVDAQLDRIPLTGVDVDRDDALVARFPAGALDEQAHVLLEESTSDVLDLACPTMAAADRLLAGIHR
jgi:hypothetical protein